ncbi:GNAT family N-acetyltransferase [Metabacillus sp. RGM 3146]|uniref:GNAT family N-acetyltransferase n=1 Tax=Metabacillus sp. RGM 3146 TaxID=3401092 RepID=UPI003B9C407A
METLQTVEIKPFSHCTIAEALEAWNKGFRDYYTPIELSADQLISRMGQMGLSPDYSFVAFDQGEPVGIILNAIKRINGKKRAWNGGTSVAVNYRSLGVGRVLVNKTLELYKKEGVDSASLEAFSVNKKAIRLYERCGYKFQDTLLFFEHKGAMPDNVFKASKVFSKHYGIPHEAGQLSFYDSEVPWQTRWNFLCSGESVIVKNDLQKEIGYAIYQRRFNEDGKLSAVVLYQCKVSETEDNKQEILLNLLNEVFPPGISYHKTTYNLPSSNELLIHLLEKAEFKEAAAPNGTPLKQAFMVFE